jgi:hypothetical protein
MQVIEVNASFVGMMISCFAVFGCILVGIIMGIETQKRNDQLRRRHAIRIKYINEMAKCDIEKAKNDGYSSGFEVGYQQALADIKTGKVKTGLHSINHKEEKS